MIRRLDGLFQGDYRTLFRGFGLELTELREYQPGDDVRYIDWNVTARLQTPYVRQYVEDREISAWFLLDLSPSVDFGTTHALKRNMLIDFVAVLARVLARHGNRVAALVFDGSRKQVIPAGAGRIHILRMINELIEWPRPAQTPLTDLAAPLNAALRMIRRRALLFIISDFISAPAWDRPLGLLTQRHEVLVIRLYDPREIGLPDIGPVVMQDAETGEQLYIDTHDRAFRKRFADAARRRERELAAIFTSRGVDVLPLSTDDDLVTRVVQFADDRKRRRALPGGKHVVSVG